MKLFKPLIKYLIFFAVVIGSAFLSNAAKNKLEVQARDQALKDLNCTCTQNLKN